MAGAGPVDRLGAARVNLARQHPAVEPERQGEPAPAGAEGGEEGEKGGGSQGLGGGMDEGRTSAGPIETNSSPPVCSATPALTLAASQATTSCPKTATDSSPAHQYSFHSCHLIKPEVRHAVAATAPTPIPRAYLSLASSAGSSGYAELHTLWLRTCHQEIRGRQM